jgi:hypothetical protein
MPLYCLVYTSVSSQEMSDDDLKALLKKSREKNKKLNITGMLLHLDPFFIQILEGEEKVVLDSFNRIKEDSRHHKVSVIYKKQIKERAFSDWTMGFNKVSDEELESLDGCFDFWEQSTPNSLAGASGEIERLLEMFKNETLF